MPASFPEFAPAPLPDGAAWAMKKLTVSTHHGAHLDVPSHYHSTPNHAFAPSEPSSAIDVIPLD